MSLTPGWTGLVVVFSCQVVSSSLQPYGLQHTRCSLSLTVSQSLPKFMSIELVMPSNHLILCYPLLLLPSIFTSIRVFSNESMVLSNHLVLCCPLLLLPSAFPSIRVISNDSFVSGGQSIRASASVFPMNIES